MLFLKNKPEMLENNFVKKKFNLEEIFLNI